MAPGRLAPSTRGPAVPLVSDPLRRRYRYRGSHPLARCGTANHKKRSVRGNPECAPTRSHRLDRMLPIIPGFAHGTDPRGANVRLADHQKRPPNADTRLDTEPLKSESSVQPL